MARAPVARWGLGYVQDQVLLTRRPRLSEKDVDFFRVLSKFRTHYAIGHASVSDGLRGDVNTQPFRFRRWMFAGQGDIDNFAEVQPALVEHIPNFLRRNMRGRTAAELLFHLFLAMLHDAGSVDDPNLPLPATRHALHNAVTLTYRILSAANGTTGPKNHIVCNSRSMTAVRLGEPMYVRVLKVADGDEEARTFRGVLVLSDSEHPGEGFEEIPERSVVGISRDLRTQIVELDA